jgi:hypothetical protein
MWQVKRLKDIVCKKHWRTIIDFSIITILAIIIFRNFIFSSGWPGGGDTLGWIAREYLYGNDFRWLNLWRPYSFGFVEGINSIDFFLTLIYSLCQSGVVTVKVFIFSTFLIAGFSMYAFAYHYTRNNLAALSASLVYILNQWFFTQFTEVHLGILFGYALAPLLFLLLSRALNHGRLKDLVLFAVALSICLTAFNQLLVAIYALFLALFIFFYIAVPQSSFHLWNRIKRVLKVLVFSGAMFLFLSAFYIMPFINNIRAPFYSAEFGYDIEEAFAISYQNMSDAFVLRGVEEWGYINIVDVTSEVSLQIIPVSAILSIIFLIGYSTVLIKTDRYTLFFLVSGLIALFLAKGPYPPYGNTFVWAWFNIPHFAVFRAASRFAVIIAFSHAFFISVLVSIVTNYISKTRGLQTKETHLELTVRTSTLQEASKTRSFSFNSLNKVLKRIKRILYYSSILLLILILLSGFFSCWFFLQNSFELYKPPETFVTPYEWIANQPQEFKIVTATPSPGEWELLPGAQTDFSSGGMLTRLGWAHDISSESAFIHDKPVLGDGGHMSGARQFVNYLRFRIARNYLSDKLLKVLGRFDYKYAVLPAYATENVASFFINQEGAEVVYNQSGSVILENVFHTPRISSTNSHVLVIGGVKSFFTASKIESFNLSQNTFVFVDQFENTDFSKEPVLNSSRTILFDDTDLLDLVMSSEDDMNVIRAEQYAMESRNYSAYWGKSSSWGDFGLLAVGGTTLSTAGKNRVSIPFEVANDGNYEVMIRIGFCGGRGNLVVHIDSLPVERLKPAADDWTNLKWVNLGSLHLEKGKHAISFTNDGTGWNDIDAVAVVESSTLENRIEQVLNQIQNYPGRIIHILSAPHTFTYDIPSGWHITTVPYQGYVLESDSPSTLLATNATILREDRYMFAIRLAQGPNQGTPQLQIDNTTVAVQHLNSSADAEWYEAGPVYLNASNHLIEIGGSGKIAFDELLIYSLEDEEQIVTLDDFSLHTTEYGWNVSPSGNASASSVGVWDTISLDADGANDGDQNTRWASKPHEPMPQWLQIEWEAPRELTGAHVLFERAHAEDYVIQTWNGADWIDQVNVKGNTELNCTYVFEEPVKTDKLRILVTSVTRLYDLVSIWEFKAYTTHNVSSVLIPEDGFYRANFRLKVGPERGTLNLSVNNEIAVISCNSSETEIKRYEIGPFYLHSGEQNITVSATGITDFDAMTITFNDEGNFGFLDDLFEAKSGPNVSYEMINSCKYEAHIENSDEPFLLIFSESYHPMWKAYIDGEEISPIPTYSLVNGFYITKTGNFNVTIYFTGQNYADIGLQISLITLIFVVVILIIPSRKFEQLGNYIKRKVRREKRKPQLSQTKGGSSQLE